MGEALFELASESEEGDTIAGDLSDEDLGKGQTEAADFDPCDWGQ
ncbi:MAG TPA: hypothetical protein VEP91_08365 [Solirubrobacterales bacterium]|nr:hypothetical protein [Solirubrobacterales bacterium]